MSVEQNSVLDDDSIEKLVDAVEKFQVVWNDSLSEYRDRIGSVGILLSKILDNGMKFSFLFPAFIDFPDIGSTLVGRNIFTRSKKQYNYSESYLFHNNPTICDLNYM